MSAYTVMSESGYTITLPACPPQCAYQIEYRVDKQHKLVTIQSVDGKRINGSTSIVVPPGGSVCLVAHESRSGAGYWADCNAAWYTRFWWWLFG